MRFAALWWRYVNGHRGKHEAMIPFDRMFPELTDDQAREPVQPADLWNTAVCWALSQPGTQVFKQTKAVHNGSEIKHGS